MRNVICTLCLVMSIFFFTLNVCAEDAGQIATTTNGVIVNDPNNQNHANNSEKLKSALDRAIKAGAHPVYRTNIQNYYKISHAVLIIDTDWLEVKNFSFLENKKLYQHACSVIDGYKKEKQYGVYHCGATQNAGTKEKQMDVYLKIKVRREGQFKWIEISQTSQRFEPVRSIKEAAHFFVAPLGDDSKENEKRFFKSFDDALEVFQKIN
ncbi:MAG: hypothetical protein GC136_10810 [Alphaproteobacteria bacterium]|nr:hypothetical protein [Alphaproteobacteria bacterium]